MSDEYMTVGRLREILREFPEDMPVELGGSGNPALGFIWIDQDNGRVLVLDSERSEEDFPLPVIYERGVRP